MQIPDVNQQKISSQRKKKKKVIVKPCNINAEGGENFPESVIMAHDHEREVIFITQPFV